MKEKELIIREIEAKISEFEGFLIGFKAFPQSLAVLQANGIEVVYGENCISENDAKFIVKYFIEKGMSLDKKFSMNIAKGIFIRRK
jgi:hypothetical protein